LASSNVREMISYNVKEVFIHKREEDNKVDNNINIHKIKDRENMNILSGVPLEMALADQLRIGLWSRRGGYQAGAEQCQAQTKLCLLAS
jgi:hypothetical protein